MKTLFTFLFLFLVAQAQAATIYIDPNLAADCTTGNYSIASFPTSTCTGSDGNAYNDVQAALTASASNDTINFRAAAITSNASGTNGIIPKTGQTWQTYPSDLPSRATITAGGSHINVFRFDTVHNVSIKNLILIGGTEEGIRNWNSNNFVISGNDVSEYNSSATSCRHGIVAGCYFVSDNCNTAATITGTIQNNVVHDEAAVVVGGGCGDGGSGGICVTGPGPTNVLITGNTVYNASHGIWFDVDSGNPLSGFTQHTVTNNLIHDIGRHCFHVEARSSGAFRNNIAYNCTETGFLVRPADTLDQLKIQNNTFYNVGATGVWIQSDLGGGGALITNASIDNNIIYADANTDHLLTIGTTHTSEATNTFKNNLFHAVNNSNGICWGDATGTSHSCDAPGTSYADTSGGISSWQSACGSKCSGNVAGDPLVVNGASANFHLQSGSPAKNAGITIGAITTDYDSVSRPQGAAYDIGAYEFIESSGKKTIILYAPGSDSGERYQF